MSRAPSVPSSSVPTALSAMSPTGVRLKKGKDPEDGMPFMRLSKTDNDVIFLMIVR